MKTTKEIKCITLKRKNELLKTMENHFQIYLRARLLTPYISDPVSSKTNPERLFRVTTSPLYQFYGYNCHFIFKADQFNTKAKLQQYQDIGYWINQSFIIELKCIIDTFIDDWDNCPLKDDKYFELLKKCRHLFAHSSYKLDYKQRKGHEKEYERALDLYKELFGQNSIENNKLNLSIDGFVIPFYEKLVELIKEKL